MRTTVKINGYKVVTSPTFNDARNWAARIYEAMKEILIDGTCEDELMESEIKKYASDGKFQLTIMGRNYEELIPEEEWISNINK